MHEQNYSLIPFGLNKYLSNIAWSQDAGTQQCAPEITQWHLDTSQPKYN